MRIMSNKVKYFLFDLDGSLLDSLANLYTSYQAFLECYGHTATQEEFNRLNGLSLTEAIEYLKKNYRLSPSTEELLTQYRSIIKENYQNSKPFKDSTKTLVLLNKLGIRMLLVSSSLENEGVEIIEKFGWTDYFERLVWGDHVEHSKPAADIYLLALNSIKERKESIIVIEDSCNGVRSAKAAGLKVLALERDFGGEELVAAGAFKSFKSLTAIVEYSNLA